VNFQKEVLPLWMSVYEKTAKLIYPLVMYCLFFADIVMVVLYGGKYESSSVYFQIKLIANFFTIISFAPLIINTGRVKYYKDVHMYGAIVLVALEYLSIILFNSPYVLTSVSVVCHIGRIFCMLWVVAELFNVRLYEIFPLSLIAKIVVPSMLILTCIRLFIVEVWDSISPPLVLFIVSFVLYISVFFVYSIIFHLDYKSIVKPLFSRMK
jgi:hypothetical protein